MYYQANNRNSRTELKIKTGEERPTLTKHIHMYKVYKT
jgi:hypothetical protein